MVETDSNRDREDGDVSASACESLLSRWDVPPSVRSATLRESLAFTRPLMDLIPEANLVHVQIDLPQGWNLYNPSILHTADGLLMTARSSNWEYKRHHYYRVNAADQIPRSRNYLLHLDVDLHPQSIVLLADATDRSAEMLSGDRGYNDLRLVEYAGTLRAVATTLDFSASDVSQMALMDVREGRLTNLSLLSDGMARAEKNWAPAIWNGELMFVYAFCPMTLLRWYGARLLPAGLRAYLGPPIALDFRGGSQLVQIDTGYLTVVHASADFDDGSRVYVHRFVSLDQEFRITGVSPQFVFQQQGIEFAAGLAIDGESVIISFGAADMESWLVRVPLTAVHRLLAPPREMTPTAQPRAALAASNNRSASAAPAASPVADSEYLSTS